MVLKLISILIDYLELNTNTHKSTSKTQEIWIILVDCIISMLTFRLLYYNLQNLTIGRNWAKLVMDLSVLFLKTANESTIISIQIPIKVNNWFSFSFSCKIYIASLHPLQSWLYLPGFYYLPYYYRRERKHLICINSHVALTNKNFYKNRTRTTDKTH